MDQYTLVRRKEKQVGGPALCGDTLAVDDKYHSSVQDWSQTISKRPMPEVVHKNYFED